MIDVTHIRRHFNSYFYQFKSEGSFSPKFYSFDLHDRTTMYLTLTRETMNRSRLRLMVINYTNEATYELVKGVKEDVYSDVTIRL